MEYDGLDYRQMGDLTCVKCGSNYFKNEFVNLNINYFYTCFKCGYINKVNYPAHQAIKKSYKIKKFIGIKNNILLFQDDKKVLLELDFNIKDLKELEKCLATFKEINNDYNINGNQNSFIHTKNNIK